VARVNPQTARYLTSGADTCTCQTYGYVRTCYGIDLVTGVRGPKTLDTGRRRPHVPSSKPTMSKNPPTEFGGQPVYPDFCIEGLGVRLCWRPVEEAASWLLPAGDVAYMEGLPTRQRDFAFFLKLLPKRPETRRFANVAGGVLTRPSPAAMPRIGRITSDSPIVSKALSAQRLESGSNE